MINLQHRAQHPVAILLDAATNRQQLFVGQLDAFAVKRAHLLELVGHEADVDTIFREVHMQTLYTRERELRISHRMAPNATLAGLLLMAHLGYVFGIPNI